MVKTLDWRSVRAALRENPELLAYRGKRGENYLHVCCGVDLAKAKLKPADSLKMAETLIDAGLGVNTEAFREGEWRATPLWYAIARNNLKLARYLLERGATPEYCLWAAAYNDNPAAVELLVNAGATVDATGDAVSSDTPLLFAVRWSRFAAAKALLERGADPNRKSQDGKTPLHIMLKKRSETRYVEMFLRHGARLDVPDANGVTPNDLRSRSK